MVWELRTDDQKRKCNWMLQEQEDDGEQGVSRKTDLQAWWVEQHCWRTPADIRTKLFNLLKKYTAYRHSSGSNIASDLSDLQTHRVFRKQSMLLRRGSVLLCSLQNPDLDKQFLWQPFYNIYYSFFSCSEERCVCSVVIKQQEITKATR